MTTDNKNASQKVTQSENHANQPAKIDRYLVDIKELPPISYKNQGGKEVKHKATSQARESIPKTKVVHSPAKRGEQQNLSEKPAVNEAPAGSRPGYLLPALRREQNPSEAKISSHSSPNSRSEFSVKGDKSAEQMPPNKEKTPIANSEVFKKRKLPFSSRDVMLGIINLISLILLIIILTKFPDKAQELKELKIQSIKNESSVSFEFIEIETSKEKASQLEDLFVDETGIVNFVSQVEKLKTQDSAIDKITFASQKTVKDKTGNYGIPILIEMNGTWQAIGQSLQEIQKMPFLLRTINVDAEPNPDSEDEGVIQFEYGGFLYVDTQLGKN